MAITYCDKDKTFHIYTNKTSYIFNILEGGLLHHLYFGKKLSKFSPENLMAYKDAAFSPINKTFGISLDTIRLEYPTYGSSDMRAPAVHVKLENGSTISEFKYDSHKIFNGKPKLEGLPATYVEHENEAQTLEICLVDELTGLKAYLLYTAFENMNAITRSVRFENTGNKALTLLQASSVSVDFDRADFDFLHLSGAWARERHIERSPLRSGIQSIESRRGASSHQHNPFIALLDKNTDEDHGDIYGFSLVYSGNFLANVEVDQLKKTRVTMGINPFNFEWRLEPGEIFQTPEVVMVYSNNGIGDMSRTYHKLYRTRLCRGKYRDSVRPILINNWEATYFNFNEEKIMKLAKTAKELGIELFVLDDGWFGKRNDDSSSLGDWFVNKEKLPNGLPALVKKVNELGMKFGLWFEPEMISPDSELYRAHPDWCLHVPDRTRSEGRNQLVLDFSRQDVRDAVYTMISDILKSAPIAYVKWDMNRHMTEVGSAALPANRQRETAHRYMLGLYSMLEKLTSEFPDVLFESCSGGGGRYDPGMLYYMPQTWTSDDTDAIERLKIQYGTSIVYPPSTMGAHVSAVPNHQIHRITPLKTRGDVAMSGMFGYELDLNSMTEDEQEEVREQIQFYKEIRTLVQFGDFYRLKSPFEGNETAWMHVAENQSKCYVVYCRVLAKPCDTFVKLKLKGLKETSTYKLLGTDKIYSGDELMYSGILIEPLPGDFQTRTWVFVEE